MEACVLASLIVQLVKNPPAMQKTLVQSLGWEDPLEEGMVTHSSILEFHGLCSPWGHKESDMTEQLSFIHGIQKDDTDYPLFRAAVQTQT